MSNVNKIHDAAGSIPGGEQEQDVYYPIEKILDKRTVFGKIEYYIKWKGQGDEGNTWRLEKHLNNKDLIKEFKDGLEHGEKEKEEREREHKGVLLNSFAASNMSSDDDSGPSQKRKRTSPELKPDADKPDVGGVADQERMDAVIIEKPKTYEKIVGSIRENGKLLFLVKIKDSEKIDLILANEVKGNDPQMVIEYYESRILWKS